MMIKILTTTQYNQQHNARALTSILNSSTTPIITLTRLFCLNNIQQQQLNHNHHHYTTYKNNGDINQQQLQSTINTFKEFKEFQISKELIDLFKENQQELRNSNDLKNNVILDKEKQEILSKINSSKIDRYQLFTDKLPQLKRLFGRISNHVGYNNKQTENGEEEQQEQGDEEQVTNQQQEKPITFLENPKDNKYGEIESRNGTKYKGGIHPISNLPDGVGEYEKSNGDIYVGEFKDGKRSGVGKYIWDNGEKSYDGNWLDDKMSGTGKFDNPKYNQWFEGMWSNGKKHGIGIFSDKDRHVRGEWVEDDLIKAHEVKYKDKVPDDFTKQSETSSNSWNIDYEYNGEFKDNKWNGIGTLLLNAYNTIYVGNFVNGKKNGQGKLLSFDNYLYSGEWKNDAPNGPNGKLLSVDNNNTTLIGDWTDGVCTNGILIQRGFSIYKGQLADMVPNGKGQEIQLDGSYYIGDYIDGKRNGFGIFRYNDGTLYEGQWQNDYKYGLGKLILTNGKGWIGTFNDFQQIQQQQKNEQSNNNNTTNLIQDIKEFELK